MTSPERCPICDEPLADGMTRCPACGRPLGDAPPGPLAPGRRGWARGGVFALRLGGTGLVAAGVVVAALAVALLPGAAGFATAVLAGGLLAGAGFAALRGASRARVHLDERRRAERQVRIVALAEKRGGSVTATDVARDLGIALDEADRELTAMADGSRVGVEVSPEGIVRYVFREVEPPAPAARVRVATEAAQEPPETDEQRRQRQTDGDC